jgi:hypothetical protein
MATVFRKISSEAYLSLLKCGVPAICYAVNGDAWAEAKLKEGKSDLIHRELHWHRWVRGDTSFRYYGTLVETSED